MEQRDVASRSFAGVEGSVERRAFLRGLAAFGLFAELKPIPEWFTDAPQLKLGVISDIHVTTPESTEDFRRALTYFRDRRADAVVVAGDLSDWGLKSGFKYVMDAWNSVFPGDKGANGKKVERLFVTGNHDYDGWWYGDMTLDMHAQGYSEDEAVSKAGVKKCWEAAFREPFASIRKRTVKGFDFISSEWHVNGKENGDEEVATWFAAHGGELDRAKPVFYFRHSQVPGTVSCSGTKPNVLTAALAKHPNLVSMAGHTHWTLNDERSIWQGDFTALAIPSMSYATVPGGHENGSDNRHGKAKVGMPYLPARENLEEAQGFFISVYEKRMVIERRDFEHNVEAAAPWIVPLGANREKPYTFEAHAKATPVPQFPEGASVATHVTNAGTRNGHWGIFMTLEFPAAKAPDGGRVWDYEVRAEFEADGKVAATKRFFAPAFYKLPSAEPDRMSFRFNCMDLPERGAYRFKVYPCNCFGAAGKPIASRVFESKPGKATAPKTPIVE